MVRGTTGGTSIYTVDGRLDDLKGRPRVSGELTAKLALAEGDLPGATAPVAVPPPRYPPLHRRRPARALQAQTFRARPLQERARPSRRRSPARRQPPLIDFKSRISGDAKGLRLDDIAVSFQHVGQPQLISGSATATWTEALNVEMSLASRWLDLDRVAKPQEGAGSPFETARNFILAMMEALPKNADSKVNFDLDQASLGGEAVSGIKLEVARAQGVLLLNNLRAGLPGGAKLALDGAVADAATGQAFRGDLTLHGTSLARFLDWAAKDKALAEAVRNEGPFSLQGRLAMSENGIALTEAGAEIAGRPITGEVHYGMKDRRRLAIALDGSEIDAAQLWPTGVSALKRVLADTGPEAAAAEKPSQFAWLDTATTDLHLRLRTGELITDRGKLRDVDLDVGVEQGRLMMRACKFVGRRRPEARDRRQRRRRDEEPARLLAVDLRCAEQGSLRDAGADVRSAGRGARSRRTPSRRSPPCASPAPSASASVKPAPPTSPPTAACRPPVGSLRRHCSTAALAIGAARPPTSPQRSTAPTFAGRHRSRFAVWLRARDRHLLRRRAKFSSRRSARRPTA